MARDRAATWAIISVVVLLTFLFFLPSVLYVVDERELAVVTQFGKPVAEITEPGLYWKMPFTQEVRKLPRPRQIWGGRPADEMPDLPTKEGNKINVTPWAMWRITQPQRFLQQLREPEEGRRRVASAVRSAIRNVVTRYDLEELIRSTDRELTFSLGVETLPEDERKALLEPGSGVVPVAPGKVTIGRQKILAHIMTEASHQLAAGLKIEGMADTQVIELIDIGIARIEFAPSVQEAAFRRQRARMEAIAARHENEGRRTSQEIINQTKAEVQKILGEGNKQASEIRGAAEAYVSDQYGKLPGPVLEFYTFLGKLDAYKESFNGDTRMIFSTKMEFFNLLEGIGGQPGLPRPAVLPTPNP